MATKWNRPTSIPTPIRVLHVINSLGNAGGAENQLAGLLSEFSDERLEHHVARLFNYTFTQLDVPCPVWPVNTEVDERPGTRTSCERLRVLIDRIKPHIVHATLAEARVAAACATRRRPILLVESLVNIAHEWVRTEDHPHVTRTKLVLHTARDRVRLRRVNHFQAISHAVADSWQRLAGIPPERVTVIYRGIDVVALGRRAQDQRPAARMFLRQLGVGPRDRFLLNVGRNEPQKGQLHLLGAFGMSEVSGSSDTHLVIAGRPGVLTSRLEADIAALALQHRVHLVGRTGLVPGLMAEASAFVFPSLYEGFGVSLGEAMALGCPVITTDRPPMNEVATLETAVLVPARDPATLAGAINEVLRSPDRARLRAAAGRQRVIEDFRQDRAARELERLYIRLASPQARAARAG